MITKKQNFNKKNNFETNYRRSYEASPIFNFTNDSEVSAGAGFLIDIGEADTKTKKYLPLSNVRIVNNSNVNIAFFPNQRSEGITIPSGTILSFDRNSIPAIYSLKFTNLDGSNSINANEVKVDVWREGQVVDDGYRKLHKALNKMLYGFRG